MEPTDWAATRAVVCGFGVSGFAAADTLLHLGADVVVLDEAAPSSDEAAERAHVLAVLGADLRLGPDPPGAGVRNGCIRSGVG